MIMEQGGGQNGISLPLQQGLGKMLHAPCAAGGDDRDAHPFGHRGGQLQIVARLGPVAVHAGQQDLTCAELFRPDRPLESVQAGVQAASVLVHIPAAAFPAPGVDGDNNALAAEAFGRFRDEPRPFDRGGVDADLIGPLAEDVVEILYRPDTAAHRKGDGQLLGHPGGQIHHGRAALMGGRDVEKHHLVGTLPGIGGGHFNRVTRIPQIHEIDALDHTAVLDIQAGDDPFGIHQAVPLTISTKFASSFCPTSPDFSGWNWKPRIRPRCTAAWNGTP